MTNDPPTNDLYVEWGRRLRVKRVSAGLHQSTLGAKAGCSGAQVSNIELGRSSASDALRMRLAAALDTTVEDLFPYPATVGEAVA